MDKEGYFMDTNWIFVSVNGIDGFISLIIKYRRKAEGWDQRHSTVLVLKAGPYGYAGLEKRLPLEGEDNVFANTFFALQRLVEADIVDSPEQGDDAGSLWDFFWFTKELVPIGEFVEALRRHGLKVEEKT